MQKDSILNIILVGVGLCIVCGAVISTVAVSLKDQQEQNVIFDQQSKIIDAARLLEVYPSNVEALAHMAAFANSPFREEFLSLITVKSFQVVGPANDKLVQVMSPYTTDFRKPIAGFTR